MTRPALTFLAWLGATFATLAAVNIAMSFYFGAIRGDLTRVGGFSERDYAAKLPQPTEIIAKNDVALEDADVIVLGDSFSNKLLWQGEFEALTGQRTLTYHYANAGCVANWIRWIQTRKLKPGALVLIESVERSFVPRFAEFMPCPPITPSPVHRQLGNYTGRWLETGLSVDIVNNLRVLANSMMLTNSQDAYVSGRVVNAALTRTDRFTNRRADRVLYHAEDEEKSAWRERQIDSAVEHLSGAKAGFASQGVRFSLLLVPDKSSVYLTDLSRPRLRPTQIAQKLHARGLWAFDTQACFRLQAENSRDFYLPDDQHLGTAGYRTLAASIAQSRCVNAPTAPVQ
jgi:hypothetical protein